MCCENKYVMYYWGALCGKKIKHRVYTVFLNAQEDLKYNPG